MTEQNPIILYRLPDGEAKVEILLKDETLWLTQKAMAKVFDVGVPAISKHLKNIFDSQELAQDATISKMETVVNRGFRGDVKELVDFYNLDAIIAVGYRVNCWKALVPSPTSKRWNTPRRSTANTSSAPSATWSTTILRR